MPLSEPQKRHLRALAHHLKPVVMVGQAGLSEAVLTETDLALTAHELIKVKISASDRAERDTIIERICHRCTAERVQRLGHVAVLFRANPEKKRPLPLPDA